MRIGVDYMQVMNDELEDRLSELEELRSSVNCCKLGFEDASKRVRNEYSDWISTMEDWLDELDEQIELYEEEIDRELDRIGPNYCD